VVAIAGAVLLAGVLAGAPGQALTSLLVAASGLLPGMWRPRPRWSLRALLRPACWGLDALVVLASGAALWYCWRQLDAVRSGAQDDVTLGLAHLPMQAAFGLAVAASAAVALLHSTTREPGWWFAFVSPAVSAGWFGAVARAYPDQVGSVGVVGGTLTLLWAAGLLLAAAGLFLLDRPSRRPSASRGSTGRADPENGAERFAASRPGAPPDDPPGWVDGAPTSSEGQSCAFCGQDDVTWVHPLDGERLTYRVHGKGHTLPAFWTLCDRCEQLHASEDVDAAVEVMRSSSPWSWVADEDVAECLHRPLAVFRSADRGARRLDR
jgi:hypothetical protein